MSEPNPTELKTNVTWGNVAAISGVLFLLFLILAVLTSDGILWVTAIAYFPFMLYASLKWFLKWTE